MMEMYQTLNSTLQELNPLYINTMNFEPVSPNITGDIDALMHPYYV